MLPCGLMSISTKEPSKQKLHITYSITEFTRNEPTPFMQQYIV